jgi:hypothetical protein
LNANAQNATNRQTAEAWRESSAVRPEDWGRSGCNVAPGVYKCLQLARLGLAREGLLSISLMCYYVIPWDFSKNTFIHSFLCSIFLKKSLKKKEKMQAIEVTLILADFCTTRPWNEAMLI